jgi:hypothetical protein
MKMNFRKVPIQRLDGNFYSCGVISPPWLQFAMDLSDLETQKSFAKSQRQTGIIPVGRLRRPICN